MKILITGHNGFIGKNVVAKTYKTNQGFKTTAEITTAVNAKIQEVLAEEGDFTVALTTGDTYRRELEDKNGLTIFCI